MSKLLPIGTYVLVRDPGCWDTGRRAMILAPKTYYAVIVGYDVFHSKYQVGARFSGWGENLFSSGGTWPGLTWCTAVTEEEARTAQAPPAEEIR